MGCCSRIHIFLKLTRFKLSSPENRLHKYTKSLKKVTKEKTDFKIKGNRDQLHTGPTVDPWSIGDYVAGNCEERNGQK